MKALIYTEPGRMEITDLKRPVVGKGQVLIRVMACGICKTDLHLFHGKFLSAFPLTPGHEFAGEVVEVGDGVGEFSVGDRVTADNTILCGECYYCRRNQPLFCENFYSLGCNGPGGFAEYVLVNAYKTFRINSLSFDEACMTEPTACAIHGMDVIKPISGDEVLLFGAGPTGIILGQLLKHGGASRVVVAAPTPFKLNKARDLFADQIIRIERDGLDLHVDEIMGPAPHGYDIVIDATGSARVVENLVRFVKYGGKVVLYGVCDENDRVSISPYEVFRKELKLMGSFAQTHCFDRALQYLKAGIVNVNDLITHTFPLTDYPDALKIVEQGKECLKVVIHPNEN